MIAPAHRLIRTFTVLVACGGLAVLAGCTAGPDSAPAAAPLASAFVVPADDSAEAGFARDMATHHAQAVDMAFLIRDRTTDERLRTLAADIIVTQSAQRGMFMGWLQLWGLPQAAAGARMAARMAWMADAGAGHAGMSHADDAIESSGAMTMMGMASAADLAALAEASGREAEILFLQLMIRHHEGGVLMARALLDRSDHDVVTSLARGIENSQAGEIETMTALLAERQAQPLPSLLQQEDPAARADG